MSLLEKINDDIKTAMRAKDKETLESLRAVKSALLLLQTDKNSKEVTESVEIALLQKLIKQRKDAAEIYKNNDREELSQKEMDQALVIEKYLPEQLSTEELEGIIKEIISKVGAQGPQDMGKVMGMASKQLAGKAEGKLIADKVKQLLAQ
jgi:uncharacterized protein YqeY